MGKKVTIMQVVYRRYKMKQDEKSPIISSGMVNGCGRGLPVDERHKNANWLPTQRTVVYGMFHKNSLNV